MTRTIVVRGHGFAPARPTEAVLSFEVAAADAERRAAAYAEALGLRRGKVLRGVEVGATDLGQEGPGPVSFGPLLDGQPELRPGTAEVSAAVDVIFELETPT